MSPGFMSGFAEWLASTTPHRVAIAEPGRLLERGDVLVAPEDRHLGIDASLRAVVSDGEAIGRFRPSGTFLFRSLARALGSRAVGVVLTGMGEDAAAGAVDIRRAGGRVIAQDESSSVIYGMPRAALARGGVDRVLPLNEIAHALIANEARCEP
jgi:two-component system chemotaxis response regulator CheB